MTKPLVIHRAKVYTGRSDCRFETALAVQGDRLLAVGKQAEGLAAGRHSQLVDLQDRFVCPGFIDCHLHLSWLAQAVGGARVNCEGTRSLSEVLERVRAGIKRVPSGGWLRGSGWDKNRWPGDSFPTAVDLDAITGDIPAALASHDGHSVWANTAAMRLAGITSATPDPPSGRCLRDASGTPTGILQETAANLVWAVVPEATEEDVTAALRITLPRLAALGITGVHDCDSGLAKVAVQALRSTGELTLRVMHLPPAVELPEVIAMTQYRDMGDEWIKIGGVKAFVDGALGGQTAAMLEPYENSDNIGLLTMTADEVTALINEATAAQVAVALHAIGDRAVRLVLDSFAAVHAKQPVLWPRHRLEHAQHIHPADQERCAALGIIASIQPAHLLADIATCERHLGARSERAFPFGSLLHKGVILACGSDAPVETVDPLVGLRAAVLRRSLDGTPVEGWYPQQCLSVAEALAGYHLNAAYASGEEKIKGSLEAGKLADFVVLSHNPLAIPLDELEAVHVLATVVGGHVVYDPEGLLTN